MKKRERGTEKKRGEVGTIYSGIVADITLLVLRVFVKVYVIRERERGRRRSRGGM